MGDYGVPTMVLEDVTSIPRTSIFGMLSLELLGQTMTSMY
jgi:hypothetical protein